MNDQGGRIKFNRVGGKRRSLGYINIEMPCQYF